MKDLLPFIIAIAYFAYKQYKKSEKNKTVNKVDTPLKDKFKTMEDKVSSLDDFIGDFFGQQGLKPEVQTVTGDIIGETQFEVENENEIEIKNEPYSIEYDDDIVEIDEKDSQFEMIQNKQQNIVQNTDFDLRKAVIYDAILNPPYISR